MQQYFWVRLNIIRPHTKACGWPRTQTALAQQRKVPPRLLIKRVAVWDKEVMSSYQGTVPIERGRERKAPSRKDLVDALRAVDLSIDAETIHRIQKMIFNAGLHTGEAINISEVILPTDDLPQHKGQGNCPPTTSHFETSSICFHSPTWA